MDVKDPKGKPAALLFTDIYDPDPDRKVYKDILEEIIHNLDRGSVNVYGKVHPERRLTTFFSITGSLMQYSGREITPVLPVENGHISKLFDMINSSEFKVMFKNITPGIILDLPTFNSVFINWYRPIGIIEEKKPDGLGWHSDDERSHSSDIILSMTYCEKNGERLFEMRPKNATSGYEWRCELPHQSFLFMLPGCQDKKKHQINSRKTNLAKKIITGGRLNLTFRALVNKKKLTDETCLKTEKICLEEL